jgi:hypothetical protein
MLIGWKLSTVNTLSVAKSPEGSSLIGVEGVVALDHRQNHGRVERLGTIVLGSLQMTEFGSLRNDTVPNSFEEKDQVEKGLRNPCSKGKKNPKDDISYVLRGIEGYLLTECLNIIDSHDTTDTRNTGTLNTDITSEDPDSTRTRLLAF